MILQVQELMGRSGHEAGRQLLEQMYRQATGKPLPPVLIAEGGKPYLQGDPLYFSISHTKRRVFCALSSRPVGIDAEELDRDIDLRLAEKLLSPGEYARFQEAEDPRKTLLTFWVLKEAQAKLRGTGLRGYPNHTDFSPEDPAVTVRDHCLVAVLEEGEERDAF